MNMVQKVVTVLSLSIALCTGCVELYDPVFCNGYNESIRLIFSLNTGRVGDITLPVGGFVYAGLSKNEKCVSLSVLSSDGQVLAAYSESDLAERKQKAHIQSEIWLLTTNGLLPMRNDQIRDWQSAIEKIEAMSRD